MLFNSLTFIVFFIIVFGLYQLPFSWTGKKIMLIVASYVFYAAWNPPYILLLWITTMVDWYVAKWLGNTENSKKRKQLLWVSLISNLGMLSYFKYGNFLLANFTKFMQTFGISYQPPEFSIILPIGISFYTFMTLSYTIDVYKKRIEPSDSFIDYALLVSFFAHLVIGPILRAKGFLPQCKTPKKATGQQIGWGLSLLVLGLFQKVILADGIGAPVSNAVFGAKELVGGTQVWVGVIAFCTQLYYDFSGYSLCAIGIALCFGFAFPDNFRFPMGGSIGFTDFWNRWHITLSHWFRDYVFLALPRGKNRRRLYLNLFIAMTLCGFWHGASWNFIIWGASYGALIVLEYQLKKKWGHLQIFSTIGFQFFFALLTFTLSHLLVVMFRAPGMEHALTYYHAMFTLKPIQVTLYTLDQWVLVCMLSLFMFVSHWYLRNTSLEAVASKMPTWLRVFVLVFMLLCITFLSGSSDAFVYFQF